MTRLTPASEDSGSLAKLQPLHELLQLRSGCSRGYRISDTVCQFVSEVEDYPLCGYCYSLMKEGTVGE